jgi:molybdenum cofactor cytidylyltransferase
VRSQVSVELAAVVLAAGLSRRMGQAKLLLTIEGRAVVRMAVDNVLAAGIERIVVVSGTEQEAIADALAGLPVRFAINPTPEAGQGSSIAVGVAALPERAGAALIVLGDQPFVPPEVIPLLVAAFTRTGQPIVAPRYRDGRGNPVLFARAVFPELLGLAGDRGARAVTERDPSRVAVVDFETPMPADIDTPEDYERLRGRGRTGKLEGL